MDLKLHKELSLNYELITKLSIIVYKRNLRMVFENPYSEQHYLSKYWCLKPKIIDKDRRKNGDYFKKPTQYWFVNCEPKDNFLFEAIDYVPTMQINNLWGTNHDDVVMRSKIHPQYANRFIRQHLIDL